MSDNLFDNCKIGQLHTGTGEQHQVAEHINLGDAPQQQDSLADKILGVFLNFARWIKGKWFA
jgi:hypothetical protein